MNKSGEPIKIIFMGTPDFAVHILETTYYVLRTTYSIVAVITQPDRPVGRKQILTPPPVKIAAEKLGLPVLQPEKLRDPQTIEQIKKLAPDLIVVAAYGQIIPKAILEIPKYGTINVHPSLLPKYRGASPIAAAIAAGDNETGVSIMLLDEELDHGPILAQARTLITPTETGRSLSEKLAKVGAELLTATLPEWINRNIKPREQNHAQTTLTKQLTREDGKIDWTRSAEKIDCHIRAFDPWPGTWTIWKRDQEIKRLRDQVRLNILKATISNFANLQISKLPGTVFKTPTGFAITCGSGALEILELQPEGKRPMSAADFLRGYPDIIGAVLSS